MVSSSGKGEGRKGDKNVASFKGQMIEGNDGNSTSKGKGKKDKKSRTPKNMKGRLRLGAKVPKGRPETESEMKEGFQMTLAETVGVEEDRIIIEDIQFLEEPP